MSMLIRTWRTMLWQSSVLILILLLLNVLLRKRVKAVFRYCLWMLLLAKLVLPVGLALPCSPAYWVRSPLPEFRKTDEGPGARQLTRAPKQAASSAAALVNTVTPPLDAQYAALEVQPETPLTDETLTTDPVVPDSGASS